MPGTDIQFCHDGRFLSGTSPYEWITTNHICRYWRDVAMSFPSIWSTIDTHCPAMAVVCLIRLKSAPLAAEIHPNFSEDLTQSIATHAARLRSFYCLMDSPDQNLLFRSFSEGAAPQLKVLDILGPRLPGFTNPALFGGRTPTVLHLKLAGFSVGHWAGSVTRLVTLALRRVGQQCQNSLTFSPSILAYRAFG